MALRDREHHNNPKEHASPWKLGGLSVVELGKRVGNRMGADEDDVFGRAAALAYYFFLALFPGLLCVLTVFGFMVGNNPQVGQRVTQSLASMMPGQASQLVDQSIQQTALHAAGWLLIVGVLGALWSASSGFASLMTTLNFAYNVKETRPWWKARAVAIGLTIVAGILMLAAILISIFGGFILSHVGAAVGMGGTLNGLWRYGQYAVALFFVILAVAVVYRWGPAVKEQKWHWITPGATFAVLLWIVASVGLRIYLHFSNSYTKSYGSLGAVIILLLWFYISGLALLIGAEVNSEIENAAAQRGRSDATPKTERQQFAA